MSQDFWGWNSKPPWFTEQNSYETQNENRESMSAVSFCGESGVSRSYLGGSSSSSALTVPLLLALFFKRRLYPLIAKLVKVLSLGSSWVDSGRLIWSEIGSAQKIRCNDSGWGLSSKLSSELRWLNQILKTRLKMYQSSAVTGCRILRLRWEQSRHGKTCAS